MLVDDAKELRQHNQLRSQIAVCQVNVKTRYQEFWVGFKAWRLYNLSRVGSNSKYCVAAGYQDMLICSLEQVPSKHTSFCASMRAFFSSVAQHHSSPCTPYFIICLSRSLHDASCHCPARLPLLSTLASKLLSKHKSLLFLLQSRTVFIKATRTTQKR